MSDHFATPARARPPGATHIHHAEYGSIWYRVSAAGDKHYWNNVEWVPKTGEHPHIASLTKLGP
jgi:hypothetical protein